jgi:hypothetical protein
MSNAFVAKHHVAMLKSPIYQQEQVVVERAMAWYEATKFPDSSLMGDRIKKREDVLEACAELERLKKEAQAPASKRHKKTGGTK